MDEKARADNRLRQQRYREIHREEINEKRRERYAERKTKNLCPRCGGKVKKGYTLCADCCEYQGKLNQQYAQNKKPAKSKTAKKTVKSAKPAKKTVKQVKKAAKPVKKAAPKTAKKAGRSPKATKKTAKKK
jgi:hypothetical protein